METPRMPPACGDRLLEQGWRMATTQPDAWGKPPAELVGTDLVEAPVPGTVAGALERAGCFDRASPQPLNGLDAWYFLDLDGDAPGPARLRFDGLATVAEIFWNGEPVLASRSMFVAQELPVELSGRDRLAICFRALAPHLERRGPRARWRPQMITPPGLRLVRTTVLGYMPGWCPEVHAAGPYRPVKLVRDDPAMPRDIRIRGWLDADGTGRLDVRFAAPGLSGAVSLNCAGHQVELRAQDGVFEGQLALPGVAAWWPHTHGEPALHDVEIVPRQRAEAVLPGCSLDERRHSRSCRRQGALRTVPSAGGGSRHEHAARSGRGDI
jgi:beta-mannosidase